MSTRTISTVIDLRAKTVTFRTTQPGVPPKMSFAAGRGDTLVWQLSGGGDGLTAFVTFVSPAASPVAGGPALQSKGGTITGRLQSGAALGEHHYQFDVEGPGLPRTTLKCFWGDDPVPTDMGGGVITDPPPSPGP